MKIEFVIDDNLVNRTIRIFFSFGFLFEGRDLKSSLKYSIDRDYFINLFNDFEIANILPKDFFINGVSKDPHRNGVIVYLSSSEFEEIKDCDQVPEYGLEGKRKEDGSIKWSLNKVQ